ncbi:FtsX-like permease family protein [Streptacidiphilus sp. EB129]|uniref:ABC transporter permease n=1 Tax=Streptacidiphilus sp. EB129 TaxID=3156262 RepID=UPI003518C550
MSALGTVVRAGVSRRRVQTLVMTLTTMMAVTASVLAAGLLVVSQGPFDHAFAAQRGAQLTVRFDPGRVGAAQVAATARVPGVTSAAGPYPVLSLAPRIGANRTGMPVGAPVPPLTVVGRSGTGGPVDDLRLTQGRWATGSGEIVLGLGDNDPVGVGDRITLPDLPGRPTLTVVGLAASVGRSADAWVSPAEAAALTAPGSTAGYQMLYRFSSAGTDAQVAADRDAIAAAVPAGAIGEAASYLPVRQAAARNSATYVPFVVAFGVLGLVMSVLIIGIVVSGAVGAATRRIGILKSLGFAPAQIVRGYVGQALIPATAGSVLGVAFGNLLAIPVLHQEGGALGIGAPGIPLWVDLAVPAAVLATAAATALVPALRAGRLSTTEALAVGRTPRAGRGRAVRRLLGRAPLPRPLSLGLAHPFARPGRSATMVAAVLLGTVGATFGVGLALSLGDVENGIGRDNAGAVTVPDFSFSDNPGAVMRTADPNAVAAVIGAQHGTRSWFGTTMTQVGVAGLAGATQVFSFQGDSSWAGYQMVSGHWIDGPGQVVAPAGLLSATGTRVGDTVTLTDNRHRVPVRIVGEVLSLHQSLYTEQATLAGLDAFVLPGSTQYSVDLTPGTDGVAYLASLNRALSPLGITALPTQQRISPTIIAMDGLAAMLTAMLVAVAGLGVLNTVLLDTRERVHDFGVLKALGMAPRQTVAMVVTSVSGIGLLAGAVGVPIGIAVHHSVLPVMGRAAGTGIPAVDLSVYRLPLLVPLLLGGLVIATAGALLPAGWAARARTATALRTE